VKAGSVVVGYLDGGTWSACFGLSYRDLLLADMVGANRIVRKGGKELRQLCGTGGIVSGRNKVAADFLDNTDGEWLWFIDTDMGFGVDTVERLVQTADKYKRPVMGGLCFKQTRKSRGEFNSERYFVQPTVYEYLELEDEVGFNPIMDYPRDQIVNVAGTGAACLLIHRRALQKVRDAHGDVWFDTVTHPAGFKGKPRSFSEDLSFCVRLQSVDLPVHVNTAVKTVHDKHGVFLDEELFDSQRNADRELTGA
jgi:hypothetical protein